MPQRFQTRDTNRSDAWPEHAQHRAQAAELVEQLTLDEKISLVSTKMALGDDAAPEAHGSAAYTAGIGRLGIPDFDESDASMGVTNPNDARGEEQATAFPSLTALGATFDQELAEQMGRALGKEARQKGFSIQLAGGINLIREPRGGRIFEYVSEDPLLSGVIAGAQVRGIQAEGVVSTLKHYAVNPQETGRVMTSSDLSEKNLRESDLLAFELAIETSQPRSIMAGYNLVNRKYASESNFLLNEVLKGDWGYRGFVMSDWGGTHSTEHAVWAGLDRQSGYQMDSAHFFGPALKAAVESGRVSLARLDDMVNRILTALISVGALQERRIPGTVDYPEHAEVARRVAERSVVLLKNVGDALPLDTAGDRLLLMGESVTAGVLAGGGSSGVTSTDSVSSEGLRIPQMNFTKIHHGPSPEEKIREEFPEREVAVLGFDAAGDDFRVTDTVVVFAEKWSTEGLDSVDLALPAEQNEAISRATAAGAQVIVVLESAGPVTMPWLDDVTAVIAAWYGGSGGAAAIAGVLSGRINPAGRLPVTFPASESDLPRTEMLDPKTTTSNPGQPRKGADINIDYDIEGADVGYRWHQREDIAPLFPFGYGLSYTSFSYRDVEFRIDATGSPVVSATIENTGQRAGVEVPQVYVAAPATDRDTGTFHLAGWGVVSLEPGESREIVIEANEPRTFASYDPDQPAWTVAEDDYEVSLACSAGGLTEATTSLKLPGRRLTYPL